jgi:2-oxo-4-hydroxy-4-carboxy-5-ureidoimidazoline decarboxylase
VIVARHARLDSLFACFLDNAPRSGLHRAAGDAARRLEAWLISGLARLNALDAAAAAAALRRCCGAARWVEAMVEARPFASERELYAAAERAATALEPDDWREAFAHHPRIGAASAAAPQAAATAAWSRQEQGAVESAPDAVRAALARGNAEYERRFGWIFLISATGKSADEMLSALRARLANDPETELRVAAAEHVQITRLRLEKLLRA